MAATTATRGNVKTKTQDLLMDDHPLVRKCIAELINSEADLGACGGSAPSTSPIDTLSDRELEVLQLLGKGQTTSQIADSLCLSVKTVETYREHLKQKLNLANGQELLRYAIEWSLSSPSK